MAGEHEGRHAQPVRADIESEAQALARFLPPTVAGDKTVDDALLSHRKAVYFTPPEKSGGKRDFRRDSEIE